MPCRIVRQGRLRPFGLTNREAFSRPVPVASCGGWLSSEKRVTPLTVMVLAGLPPINDPISMTAW